MSSWITTPGGDVGRFLEAKNLESAYAAFINGFFGLMYECDTEGNAVLYPEENPILAVVNLYPEAGCEEDYEQYIYAWVYEWLNRWPTFTLRFAWQQLAMRMDFPNGDKRFLCPVCAFDGLPSPLDNCSCCGLCALHLEARDPYRAFEPYREEWISEGAPFRNAEAKPQGWSAIEQMKGADVALAAAERAAIQRRLVQPEVVAGGKLVTPAPWPIWEELRAVSAPPSGWNGVISHLRKVSRAAA